MSAKEIQQTSRYVTFKLGDELFAIGVSKAREVLDVTHVTRVPTAPDYMRGVVNVRGNSIPVIDLRKKFGLPATPDTNATRIIVLELMIDGVSAIVGGLADSVHEVIELEPSEINESPSIGMKWRNDLILGMGKRDEQFIIILDIELILTDDENAVLSTGEESVATAIAT